MPTATRTVRAPPCRQVRCCHSRPCWSGWSERDVPGQVLEVELEQEGERWTYEVRLLQAGGRLVKLNVDAATGEVLQRRDRSRDGGHRH